jgi:hypothetical protein
VVNPCLCTSESADYGLDATVAGTTILGTVVRDRVVRAVPMQLLGLFERNLSQAVDAHVGQRLARRESVDNFHIQSTRPRA